MEPITRIILYKNVPFRSDYMCVTDFVDEAQREAYLNRFSPRVIENRTYIKYNDVNTLNLSFDEVHGIYNYMAYSNEQDSNGNNINYKFAFITDVKWASNNSTFVRVTPDIFQNELFNFSFGASRIAREHQDRYKGDATPNFNYEGDTQYKPDIIEEKKICEVVSNDFYMVFVFSDLPDFTNDNIIFEGSEPHSSLGGDSFLYWIVPINKDFTGQNAQDILTTAFHTVYSKPELYKIYIIPHIIPLAYFTTCRMTLIDEGYIEGYTFNNTIENDYETQYTISVDNESYISSISEIQPYVSKNIEREPKINTMPYTILRMGTDKMNSDYSVPYSSQSSNIKVKFRCSLSSDGLKASLYIPDYVGDENGIITAVEISHCAELPLKNDVWQNYLSTHSAVLFPELIGSILSSSISAVFGLATQNAGGVVNAVSGLASSASLIGVKANMEQTPISVRSSINNAVGDINSRKYGPRIAISLITLNPEYRRRLCELWYWYGYPSNETKIPNIRSRYYFNYIKTVNCIINGVSDNAERAMLENIFNSGVTVYHCRTINSLPYVCDYGDCQFENTEVSLIQ